jgi:hypothetical protein
MTMQDKELIQDVVDRLLYLHETDRQYFDELLKELLDIYPVPYTEIEGIRVYSIKPKQQHYVRK